MVGERLSYFLSDILVLGSESKVQLETGRTLATVFGILCMLSDDDVDTGSMSELGLALCGRALTRFVKRRLASLFDADVFDGFGNNRSVADLRLSSRDLLSCKP